MWPTKRAALNIINLELFPRKIDNDGLNRKQGEQQQRQRRPLRGGTSSQRGRRRLLQGCNQQHVRLPKCYGVFGSQIVVVAAPLVHAASVCVCVCFLCVRLIELSILESLQDYSKVKLLNGHLSNGRLNWGGSPLPENQWQRL